MSKSDGLVDKIQELRRELREASKGSADTTLIEHAKKNGIKSTKHALKLKRTLKGHAAKIHDLDFCHSRPELLLSASQDGKLIVWNGPTTHKVFVVPLESQWVLTAGISLNGNYVASGGLDNSVSIFPLDEEEPIPKISCELKGHDGSISKIRFLTDDQVISASGDCVIKQWDAGEETCIRDYNGHTKDVSALAIASDRNTFVTGSLDQSCYLWDARVGEAVMSVSGHSSDINSVSFFPSDTAFASASDDGTVRLYDLRGDRTLQVYTQQEDEENWFRVLGVAFSSSGKFMYTANHLFCYVYNTLTGELVQSLSHDNFVSCIAVPSDGSCVATGCWDNYLRIYL